MANMKGDNIATRLQRFAVAVIRTIRNLPQDVVGKHIARQLIRSATGGGANYEEARGAESSADFVHKVRVAAKEMRESLYWLDIIDMAGLDPKGDVRGLIQETNELVAILTSSANTAARRTGELRNRKQKTENCQKPNKYRMV